MDVSTNKYNPKLDIFSSCRNTTHMAALSVDKASN